MTAEDFRKKIGFQVSSSLGNHTVQDRFNQAIDDLKVLARATPDDKKMIAEGLKRMGKKIAVVGDGMNDVETFPIADVSFAMGSSCSFARHHASMVLVEDDFEACIWSVIWGRNIYCNIKRFL